MHDLQERLQYSCQVRQRLFGHRQVRGILHPRHDPAGHVLGVLLKWAIPAEIEGSQVKYVSAMCVYIFLGLCGTGLLLMSLFELISAAVTHGIYRAYPERCPYCKSHTFISKA
jgi:hypothetical protein